MKHGYRAFTMQGLIVVLLAAAGAAAVGFLAARNRQHMLPLKDAAQAAYDAARREGMVIAGVAEDLGGAVGAVGWFIRSIARVVPVYESGTGKGPFHKLDRSHTALAGTDVGRDEQSLYIQKRDLRSYIRWARSMQ